MRNPSAQGTIGLLRATLVLLVCVAALAVAAPADQSRAQEEITLSAADAGRAVTLTEMQELAIVLPANPSTGYAWQVDGLDARMLAVVETADLSYSDAAPGAVAQQGLRFRAIASGTTDLRLVYRRPWETGTPPLASFAVTVTGLGPFTGAYVPRPTPTPAPAPRLAIEPAYDINGQALPAHFNWCEQGGCTPVKDQGNCGSCWAFATVGVLELNIKIKDGLTKDLSEQYLVSCNTDGYNCTDGGLWAHKYHQDYIPPSQWAAGAVYESDFPYTGLDATTTWPRTSCKTYLAHHERISAWANVPGASLNTVPPVAQMKQALYTYGPLAVGVCAGNQFTNYRGGVFRTDETSVCRYGTNHGVVLVGWNDADGAWYLRNSWGPLWGESGYMRIAYGVSRVGEDATYVVYGSSPPVNPTPSPTPVNPTPSPTPRPGTIWRVYLPVIARQEPPPTPTGFLNPGFELGARHWTQYSWQGWTIILSTEDLRISPHGGSWAAWLGGDNNEISYVEQRVTVPAERPYLTYWHWIGSTDVCGYDFGGVIINRTRVVDQYNLCAATETGGWVRHSVNLSAYRGQTVTVQIRAETDSSNHSNLFVDDVSFQATAAAGADESPPNGLPDAPSKVDRAVSRGAPAGAEAPRLFAP